MTAIEGQYPHTNTVGGGKLTTNGTNPSTVVPPSAERFHPAAAVNFCDREATGTYSGIRLHTPIPTAASTILSGASSLQHKENENPRRSPEWLHRNDNYIRSHQMYGNNARQQSTEFHHGPGESAFR